MDNSREMAGREVLFYAECQLAGMKALNKERVRNGFALAYNEDAFLNLAENTRAAYRKATE